MKKTHDILEIENFNYKFKDFFVKPLKKTKFRDIEREIYGTANKVGRWLIYTFIAYQGIIIVNYLFQMFAVNYTAIDIDVPDYFISIVSAVIGFYFGQRYQNLKDN